MDGPRLKLSDALKLLLGNIICSGTPKSVAPVVCGEVIGRRIEGLPNLSLNIIWSELGCADQVWWHDLYPS